MHNLDYFTKGMSAFICYVDIYDTYAPWFIHVFTYISSQFGHL